MYPSPVCMCISGFQVEAYTLSFYLLMVSTTATMMCAVLTYNRTRRRRMKKRGWKWRERQSQSLVSWVQTCMPPCGGSPPIDHLLRQTHTVNNTCDGGPIPILLLKYANIVPLPVIVLITSDRHVVFYLFHCVCDCCICICILTMCV